MVTVTNAHQVTTKDGKSFIALELTGSVQLIQNSKGKFFATTQRCRIPSTLNAETAKMMIGSKIEGEIIRVQTEAYNYLNKTTGEIMQLQHSYSYCPPGSMSLIGETRVGELQAN